MGTLESRVPSCSRGEPMDCSVALVLPIFLFLACAVGLAVALLLLANLLNPNRRRLVEPAPYESGMDPVHDTHRRFNVRFYLLAIAFLVFDVELLFLYPWAVAWQPEGSQEARWEGERAGRLRDGETGRQGDRVTGRQGDRETGRQGDRGTGRQGDRETGRQGDRETGTQGDRETGRREGTEREGRRTDRLVSSSPCSPAGWPGVSRRDGVSRLADGRVCIRLAEGGLSMAVSPAPQEAQGFPAAIVELPENVAITKLDELVSWCRKYSLWPMPFATACCGIELMATGGEPARHCPLRRGGLPLQSPAVRPDDRRRAGGNEDAARVAADLAANARAEVVYFDGRLRFDRRRLRHLLRGPGHRPLPAGRYVLRRDAPRGPSN